MRDENNEYYIPKEIIIPEGETKISKAAFRGVESIEKVVLSEEGPLLVLQLKQLLLNH